MVGDSGQAACLRNGGWLVVVKNKDVAMTLRRGDVVAKDVAYFHQLRVKARDGLGRLASQCQQRVWLVDLYKIANLGPLLPDPWETGRAPKLPDPAPFVDDADLENVVLGGGGGGPCPRHAVRRRDGPPAGRGFGLQDDRGHGAAGGRRGHVVLLHDASAGLKALVPFASRMDEIVK